MAPRSAGKSTAAPAPRKRKSAAALSTERTLRKVRKLAGLGLTLEQIARELGVEVMTFKRMRKADPGIDAAYQRGRAKVLADMAGVLVKQAKRGNAAAAMFFLKCQGRWSEVNGAPASHDDAAGADLSREELEDRIREAVREWSQPLLDIAIQEVERRHRCRVIFQDAVTPPLTLPEPPVDIPAPIDVPAL